MDVEMVVSLASSLSLVSLLVVTRAVSCPALTNFLTGIY